jgi:uncharacterized protein (TIGR00159 family)
MLFFIDFSILDALDILLVATLLYYVYKLLKGSVAINIFVGIALVVLVWKITEALQMELLSGLLGTLVSLGAIAVLILFQPEVRKFLLMVGSTSFTNRRNFLKQIHFLKKDHRLSLNVDEVISACEYFSNTFTGALMVFERTNNLDFIKNNGDKMRALVNQPMLESIYFKNGPLHDGAVVISGNYILATRVMLPITGKKINARYGFRHRAAVGITERTDAVCLVVSEENGRISYIKDGYFEKFQNLEELKDLFIKDLK